jgi:hypothetical protein
MIFAITGRLVARLVGVCCRWPLLTVIICVTLAVLGAGHAARRLTVQTSKLDLLPSSQRYVQLFRAYADDFGAMDDIVVVVRGRNVTESTAFAEALVARLRAGSGAFERIAYRVDPQRFAGGALLYLPFERLERIYHRVDDHQELLQGFVARPTLDEMVAAINQQVAEAFVAHAFDVGLRESPAAEDLRLLREMLGLITRRLDGPAEYRSPWDTLLAVETDPATMGGYFLSADRSLLFIVVTPASGARSFPELRAATQLVRREIGALRGQFPSLSAGVTGAPALYNDELSMAFDDSRVATVLAAVLTLGLLLLAFRRVGKPLLMLGALAVGLAWSMGVITVTVGHLTIFSVMFLSIVIGIGIDYGIYVLFRYEEERGLGHDLASALAVTAERSGPGVVVSVCAAAATFFVLGVTDFPGIREFGFISGAAILLTGLVMLTLFPALLVLSGRPATSGALPAMARLHAAVPVLDRLARHPWAVLGPAGVLAAVALVAVPGLDIDYNMLNLQAHGTESVAWERTILGTARRSGFPAVTSAASLTELKDRHQAFARLGSVSEVESIMVVIPDRQPEKIALIGRLAPLVAGLVIQAPRPLDLDRLTAATVTLGRRLRIATASDLPGELRAGVLAAQREVEGLLGRLQTGHRAAMAAALEELQSQVHRDFVEKFAFLQRNLEPRPIEVADLPDELRHRFVGRSGRLLLEIHPRIDIWTRAGAEGFVSELRSVDRDVTGQPVIAFESIKLMETAYRQGTLYAFALVAVLAVLMIRRPDEAAMALVPLVLGTLWGLGLMRACGLTFNLANVWGIPLVLGAAAEFGLNIVLRFREAREHGGSPLPRSTALSVALNGLTTIAGFGSLLVAHHYGIWSLGLLLVIGTVTSLVASLVVLPALLRVVYRVEPAPVT